MTTVAQNRWIELITIEQGVEIVGSDVETVGGWRYCRGDSCVTDADGGALVQTSSDYASSIYGSASIERPSLPIGSLIGMWIGSAPDLFTLQLDEFFELGLAEVFNLSLLDSAGVFGSTPFLIGSSYAGLVPVSASSLVLAFHDQHQWNNNYGSQNVEVVFDGLGPSNHVVHATQCLYFRFAGEDLLGPEPYYENIGRDNTQNIYRPLEVDSPHNAAIVSITASSDVAQVEVDNTYSYLKLQRYLFDPVEYAGLTPRQMLWKRGYQAQEYNSFLLEDDTLNSVSPTYDCIACGILGTSFCSTIVSIKTDVRAPMTRIMQRINKTQILPQRVC